MIKPLLCLGLLLAFQGYGVSDEKLGQVLSDVLNGIPGESAVWTETYGLFMGAEREQPFFSPAIVRMGGTEEYRIVQSDLLLYHKETYSASFFFTVLSPDDQLSLEVIPASGVKVSYQHNAAAHLPLGAIQERILLAEAMLREYYRLEGQIQSGFGIGAFAATGLLSGAGLIWLATTGYRQMSPLDAGGLGTLLGVITSLTLWAAIESLQIRGSNNSRMEEIRHSLHTLWQ